MHLEKTIDDSMVASIIVRPDTRRRLEGTCFRGSFYKCAGNFVYWNSAREVCNDETVMRCLLNEIRMRWQKREFSTGSLTIECGAKVGWESTAPIELYRPDSLVEFELNRRSCGKRVKKHLVGIKAPLTHRLTVVFEFKDEFNSPVMIIHSIYPGVDIGELDGDVTAREKRVFFDFSHPGE